MDSKPFKAEIVIVDENDDQIGTKERELIKPNDIYRVSALWITDIDGNILLAQRSFKKSHSPGKWGPAVAGTVEKNEMYHTNIIKEAKEELGIEINATESVKLRISGKHNYFVQWFKAVIDKNSPFNLRKDEVEGVKWISRKNLLAELKSNPNDYIKEMSEYIEIFKIK